MSAEILIRHQKIKVQCFTEEAALDCNQYLKEIISGQLPKIYERIFAESVRPNIYINLNTIKIDLGMISKGDFCNEFLNLVKEKLTKNVAEQFEKSLKENYLRQPDDPDSLGSYLAEEKSEQLSVFYLKEQEQLKTALFFYLEFGRYPWWYKNIDKKTVSRALSIFNEEEDRQFFNQLLKLIQTFPADSAEQLIDRFIDGFNQIELKKYIFFFADLKVENRSIVDAMLKKQEQIQSLFNISEKSFFKRLLRFSLFANHRADFLEEFLTDIQSPKNLTSSMLAQRILGPDFPTDLLTSSNRVNGSKMKTSVTKISYTDKNDDYVYVQNAGLILLHPFLTKYFFELGLLDDKNEFSSTKKQHRAVILLNYLQSGSIDYQEWEMPLNKILVGLGISDFVPIGIKLTKKEKEESKNLLATVVNYWTALKTSKPEALQQNFFLREGKISKKNENRLIQIERTGVDILLDKLPWSIGIIKLPWLSELIHVEW